MPSLLKTAIRYYYQVKYLNLVQIHARLKKRFIKPVVPGLAPAAPLNRPPGEWVPQAPMPHYRLDKEHFVLLGEERRLTLPADWNNRDLGKKWLMELHGFHLLCGESGYDSEDLIASWIHHNRHAQGPGWHPYVTSQRICNWLKWGLAGHSLQDTARASIAQQVKYLLQVLEYDELDHKLLNNGKALLFAAYLLQDRDSGHWHKTGWMLIEQCCLGLVGDDGGYIGLSPMYHCALLFDLLDLINLLQTCGEPVPEYLDKATRSARHWLANICHPDGGISLFNDSTFKVVAAPRDLEEYARRLGYPAVEATREALVFLAESGFARMARGPAVALLDAGRIGPDHAASHGHADTLTFELSLNNQRIIVDTGLSTYEKMPERLQLRGTAAHNTVLVDHRNSSDVWGLFKVGRRASILNVTHSAGVDNLYLGASHDGYSRPGQRILHCREWEMIDQKLIIRDELMGRDTHHVAIMYHLHPDLEARSLGGNRFSLELRSGKSQCLLELDQALKVEIASYDYHPAFNQSIPATCLVASHRGVLPLGFTCTMTW